MKKLLPLLLALLCGAAFADTKISALPAGSTLAGTEQIPAVQSGATVSVTPAQVVTYTNSSNSYRTIADSTGNLSYCGGFNACANAVFSTALKGFVTAFGDRACGGLGTGLSVNGGNIEDTCIGWGAGASLGAGSQYVTVGGVGSLRYAPLAVNVTIWGVDSVTSATTQTGTIGPDVGAFGVGDLRNPQTFSNAWVIGDNSLVGQASSSPSHVLVYGSRSLNNASLASPTNGIVYGDDVGDAITSATFFALLGPNIANTTCATGTHIWLSGTYSSVDCPAAGTSNYLNLEGILTATGTGTPASSTANFAGNLQIQGVNAPRATDVQTFTASGTWTKPTAGTPVLTEAICYGAGGGGGSGAEATVLAADSGGAGGGAGGSFDFSFPTSSLGATETVTIGVGGTAGAAATGAGAGNAGGIGGTSTFGSWASAYGGGGGAGGQTTATNSGGGGGGGLYNAGATGTNSAGGGGGNTGSGSGGFGANGNQAAYGGGGAGGGGGTQAAAGGAGANANFPAAPSGGAGGGAGGGTSASAAFAGGNGGRAPLSQSAPAGGSLGTTGSNGNPGVTPVGYGPGSGGSGGGGGSAGTGGTGGTGGRASGGGGGGASVGANSGAGGVGGGGFCAIITRY